MRPQDETVYVRRALEINMDESDDAADATAEHDLSDPASIH